MLPIYEGESFQVGDTVLAVQDSVLGVSSRWSPTEGRAADDERLGDMVGPSKVMRHTFELILRFAPHGYSVLIVGKSGFLRKTLSAEAESAVGRG